MISPPMNNLPEPLAIDRISESRAALLEILNQGYGRNYQKISRGAYLMGWIAAENGESRDVNPFRDRKFILVWDKGYSGFKRWLNKGKRNAIKTL